MILVGVYAVLASVNTPAYSSNLWNVLLWVPLFFFLILTGWIFYNRRKEGLLCWLFMIFGILASAAGIGYAIFTGSGMVLWHQRALDLTNGVSPATPLLLLLLGLYFWFWYSLWGVSLVDWRRPQLPDELPKDYFRLTDSVEPIRRVIQPFSGPLWLSAIPVIAAILGFVLTWESAPGHVSIRSLEGLRFDAAYLILLGLSLVVLITTLLRMIALWRRFRLMLSGLDRAGMKDAIRRLSGFEWNVIWNPARSTQKEGYKLISREIHCIERLSQSLGKADNPDTDPYKPLRERIKEILELRDKLIDIVRVSGNRRSIEEKPLG